MMDRIQTKNMYLDRIIKHGSILSAIWIFSFPTSINIVFSVVLSLWIIICQSKGCICLDSDQEIRKVQIKKRIMLLFIAIIIGMCFFKRWSVPDTFILVPDMILNCSNIFIGVITVVLIIGFFLFLLQIASQYTTNSSRSIIINKSVDKDICFHLIHLFLIAAITIALCSKSSILYPFNDASDGNCFFTVGKSLMKGKVLYRDLFEQKGPYIYFLHSFASFISEKTFLGVFIFEVVSAFIFLCIIYKTLCLFREDVPIAMIALFAALLFSQGGFTHGDEIEEFCLPIISLTNYYLLRYVNDRTKIQPKEMLLVGILAGCVFWSKYTICGYFACWYVFVAIHQIKQHRLNSLIRCFIAGLAGVVISTIPILIYFAANKSLNDLWKSYFVANLFNYNNIDTGILVSISSVVINIAHGIWISLRYNLVTCVIILCGVFWLRSFKERILYTILLAVTLLFICAGLDSQKYYPFIFAAFTAPGILFIWSYTEQIVRFRKGKGLIPFAICASISLSLSPNIYMFGYTQKELPQYRFAEIIKESQNATLLNYGFLDGGYYTTSDIVPNCKYFCKLNIVIPEAEELQNYYINNGLTEFVVCRDQTIDSDYYVLCDFCTYFYENAYRTDYLFRLKQKNLR